MTCGKKSAKAQKKAHKAFAKAQKTTGKKAARFNKVADKQAQTFNKVASKQAHTAGKKFEDIQNTVATKVQEQVKQATPVVEDAMSKARVKAGVLAAVAADKLNDYEIPEQAQVLAEKAGYDKKSLKNAQKQAVKSAKAYAKQQKKAEKRGGKGLLLTGMMAAAGVAGYAAYKASRPVEDPWKTPSKPVENKTVAPVAADKSAAPVQTKLVETRANQPESTTKPVTETKPATTPKTASANTVAGNKGVTEKADDADSDIAKRDARNSAGVNKAKEAQSDDVVAQTSKAPATGAINAAPATDAAQNSRATANKPTTSTELKADAAKKNTTNTNNKK